jgi:uncharacterized protein with HEPN domain
MFIAALLKTMDEAGVAVLTLTEGLEDEELLGSRLTRQEVLRHLRQWAEAAEGMPTAQQQGMPEIDWPGLAAAGRTLMGAPCPALDEALVFATRSLVPATLMWLRLYRQQQPQWFNLSMAPG